MMNRSSYTFWAVLIVAITVAVAACVAIVNTPDAFYSRLLHVARSRRAVATDPVVPKLTIRLAPATDPTITRVDLCSLVECAGGPEMWTNYTVYLCRFDTGQPHPSQKWCNEYPRLFWTTVGKHYEPAHNQKMMDFQRLIDIKRDRPYKAGDELNPIEISIKPPSVLPWPDLTEFFYLVLAVDTGNPLAHEEVHPQALIKVYLPIDVKEEVDVAEQSWDLYSSLQFYVHAVPGLQTFDFNICDVVECKANPKRWESHPVVMWIYDNGYPKAHNEGCSDRDLILWNTSTPVVEIEKYSLKNDVKFEDKVELQNRIGIVRSRDGDTHNRMLLTVSWVPGRLSPWGTHYIYLGIGTGRLNIVSTAMIKLNLNVPVPQEKIDQSILDVQTGFVQMNYWTTWVEATAKSITNQSCVACARSRPELKTIPSPFSENQTFCMLHLHTTENPIPECKWLEASYPLAPSRVVPPVFTPVKAKHLCLRRTKVPGRKVGDIPTDWCRDILNVNSWVNATQLVVARSDVYWYCGRGTLLNVLTPEWIGTCTILSLLAPLTLVPASAADITTWRSSMSARLDHDRLLSRQRRAVQNPSFDLYGGSPVYIDAIGVPRGIPDQFKLVDEVVAGFESLIPQITINKNVQRINYVHFSLQRLTNFTRDAIQGIHEQLSATSVMAQQNRMALDFLLAEAGGTCALIGVQCCTWIPNNTDSSNGSITRALNGLRGMSVELAEQSGVDNRLSRWLYKTFGEWQHTIVTVLVSLVAVIIVLGIIGCCCVPCIRQLISRCLVSAVDAANVTSSQHVMVQFRGPPAPLQPDRCSYDAVFDSVVSTAGRTRQPR